MKQAPMNWITDRLGLVALEEDEQGRVVASAAAREVLGPGDYPSLGIALRRLVGDTVTAPSLDDALASVRKQGRSEMQVGEHQQLLLAQDASGRVLAMLSPRPSTAPAAAPAAAASADVRAGVSHELANALGAIAGWARLAKQGRRVQEALDLIEMSAESAWSAAQRVLGDHRTMTDGPSASVDLSAFVDEAARLLGPKATAKGVLVRTAIEPGLRVRGDRGSAWSITWNLAANAVEALSPGGTVELRLRSQGDNALLT
ncbi:MAG: sensor histidine kinase, partial [Polyangiales bacterium]